MELLYDFGTIPSHYLRTMIIDRNLNDMPDIMRDAILKCLEIPIGKKDIGYLDIVLDGAKYLHAKEIADKSHNDFAKKLVSTSIDLNNIKLLFRARRLKKSSDFLEPILLEGGFINTKIFLECMETSPQEVEQQFKNSDYQYVVKDSLKKTKDDTSMWQLEKLSDDFIINIIKETRFYFSGVEPLMAYLIAKENEIKNVRMILISKINGIAPSNIRERLRISYV
jgi:V/A-type H+-transporting ATPase subunit C